MTRLDVSGLADLARNREKAGRVVVNPKVCGCLVNRTNGRLLAMCPAHRVTIPFWTDRRTPAERAAAREFMARRRELQPGV